MADTTSVTDRSEKFCPFAGMSISGDELTGVKCIKDKCQLWIPNYVTDSTDQFKMNVNTLSASFGCWDTTGGGIGPSGNINLEGGRCGAQVADYIENLYRLVHHSHKNHLHPYGHAEWAETFSQGGGKSNMFEMPKSSIITQEYMTGEDYDGNGLIYGNDFYVSYSKNSITLPPMIESLNSMIVSKPYHYVSWEDCKDDKFPPMYVSMQPNIINFTNNGIIKLTGGYFTKNHMKLEFRYNDSILATIDLDENSGLTSIEDGIWKSERELYFMIPDMPEPIDGSDYYVDILLTNYGNVFNPSNTEDRADQDALLEEYNTAIANTPDESEDPEAYQDYVTNVLDVLKSRLSDSTVLNLLYGCSGTAIYTNRLKITNNIDDATLQTTLRNEWQALIDSN